MSERDSFIFYRSFYEAIRDLPRDIQGEVYTAIMEYSLNGITTENLKPVANCVFILIKHYIDKQGRRGGFKGITHSENRIIRNSAEARQWRRSVFERDKYICQECKNTGIRLHAHHIKEFALYPSLRFEVNNGITLCKLCHNKIHRKK